MPICGSAFADCFAKSIPKSNYAKYDGEVLYDGVDIRKLDIEKLNEMSSVIHQNVYMFDESIQNKQIAPTALQKALDMSGVTMFLGEEKTLDTSVGENGKIKHPGTLVTVSKHKIHITPRIFFLRYQTRCTAFFHSQGLHRHQPCGTGNDVSYAAAIYVCHV